MSELGDTFRDGAWFVNLAPLSDPELVASTLAQMLSVTEMPGTALAETLQGFLCDKQALLLVDNFEQLLAAAPLRAAAPSCKVRVTQVRRPDVLCPGQIRNRGKHE